MNIWKTIKLSLEALLANKMRAFLTMLGVIIGVASVILLVAIGNGLKSYITEQLESLGADALFIIPGELSVGAEGEGGGVPGAGMAASKFTFDHLQDLKRNATTIKAIMAYTENNGTMKYRGKSHITQVSGVGPEYPEVRDQPVSQGSFFTTAQYNSARKVAVLGTTVAEELFGDEDPLNKKITISGQHYLVLGILEEKGSFGQVDMDNLVYIPATTAMRQFDMENIQSFWVQSLGSETVPETKREIEEILLRSLEDDEFSVMETKNILSAVTRILGTLTAALVGIAAISLVVGGIGIMNIMLVSVTERTREIGLRKAVGATPRAILIQFLIEAVILSFLGGTAGIAIGAGTALILNRFFTTLVTFGAVALAFGVSALVGVIFGVAPAAKAARLNPIDALRYE